MKIMGWDLLDRRTHIGIASVLGVAGLLAAGFAGVGIGLGIYNIGADAPHIHPVYVMLETLRDRSIAVRAQNIKAPADLNDPKRISTGAGLYTEMCSGCHLGPGLEKTEMSQGLYPAAPELWRHADLTAGEQFWAIKHGIKMTAMPAWGKTHSDELIWDMVAFVRQLPKMSPAQYQATIKSAPADHDEVMKGMPGMSMKGDEKPVP